MVFERRCCPVAATNGVQSPLHRKRLTACSVIVAQKTTVPDWLEAVGTVRAAQTSQVSSQMMGNIVEIRAQEGDRVQSGQVLATIDDAQPRSAVNQAMAALAAAKKEVSAADSDLALAQSDAEALPAALRQEIGQPAGIR